MTRRIQVVAATRWSSARYRSPKRPAPCSSRSPAGVNFQRSLQGQYWDRRRHAAPAPGSPSARPSTPAVTGQVLRQSLERATPKVFATKKSFHDHGTAKVREAHPWRPTCVDIHVSSAARPQSARRRQAARGPQEGSPIIQRPSSPKRSRKNFLGR